MGAKNWRFYFICSLLGIFALGILYRLVDLNVLNRTFLLKQSQSRILRVIDIPAHRGMIMDRRGVPLAISMPVASVWIQPQLFHPPRSELLTLSTLLGMRAVDILQRAKHHAQRQFVYLKRGISPKTALSIQKLHIPGIFFQSEYRRYYPEGDSAAHVVGITDVDDKGQEGLELAYDGWLRGKPGKKEVIKDRLGHIISEIAILRHPQWGRPLVLSLDQRLQYSAHRALESTVANYAAAAGSVVVLNIKTGEILAMSNLPSYDPNRRGKDKSTYRNRAVTDTFEPGSVMKPFTLALALESGNFTKDTEIDTNPGWIRVGGYTVRDDLNYGVVTLTQLLQKSSNIAAAKILMSLQPGHYWDLLHQLGFGSVTSSGFPGEVPGSLVRRNTWPPSVVAALAYGYGISVTALQLAQAYAILGAGGIKRPITFLRRDKPAMGQAVLPKAVANTLLQMLATVVQPTGTGWRAHVSGYQVAGKTGTAYIAQGKGYNENLYMSSFVGIAPLHDPKFVVAVVIRAPQHEHFGGIVAAPLFSRIMTDALRWGE